MGIIAGWSPCSRQNEEAPVDVKADNDQLSVKALLCDSPDHIYCWLCLL